MSRSRPSLSASALPDVSVLVAGLDGAPSGELRLDQIDVRPDFNPRGRFSADPYSPEALADLTEDIRTRGLLQPLLVRPQGGRYQLVAGHRRYHASRLAGLAAVPALVRELSDEQAREVVIVENVKRQGFDIVDETFAVLDLMADLTGEPVERLPALLNRLKNGTAEDTHGVTALLRGLGGWTVATWAQQRVKFLSMTPQELQAVKAREIDAKVAYELTRLPEGQPERTELLQQARRSALSATAVRARVDAALVASRPRDLHDAARDTLRGITASRVRRLKTAERQQLERLLHEIRRIVEG